MPDKPQKLQSSTEASIQDGTTGAGLVQQRRLQPRWGRLTANGPESAPDSYEWESLYRDNDQDWQALEDIRQGSRGSYTVERESDPHDDLLLDPAVEANGRKAPIGSVVWLEPGKIFADEDGNKHREWIFHWDENLRPFVLAEDLIPTGGGELDTTVKGEWLDLSFAEGPLSLDDLAVTLYPEHKSGWPAGDQFIALGIGQAPSTYFRGTYGWARYTPKGTAIGEDEKGIIWRGEWQIVTLYALLTAAVEVHEYEPDPVGAPGVFRDPIASGDEGLCKLFWIDKHNDNPGMIDSGYTVNVHNDNQAPLATGDRIYVRFDRGAYIWTPSNPPQTSGITIYDSGAGQGSSNNYAVVACDLTLNSYGHHLERDGNTIKNVSDVDVVGIVSYKGVAQRDLDPPPDAPGPDAICHFAVFNDGVIVDPTDSRLTSSRRRLPTAPETAAQMGPKAVNTSGASFTILLKAGEAIDLRFKHSLSLNVPVGTDTFDTVGGLNMLSFITVTNVVMN